jgi:uncharacterized membrane protein YfcA
LLTVAPYTLAVKLILIGFVAGISSGLFGVGGGLVMVPLLVWLCGMDQRRAHATSLAAIIAIAGVAAFVFAHNGSVDLRAGAVLAVGALVGAPLGARLLSRTEAGRVRIVFGVFQLIVGLILVLQ